MVGEPPNDGSQRHRHSGHHEDSDGEGNMGREGSQSTSNDINDSRSSVDQEQRIRYSHEVERRPDKKTRNGDEIEEHGEHNSEGGPKTSILSVNTGAAAEGRAGDDTVKSSSSTTIAGSPQYELGSPTASKRHRGMSLRSALLNRNLSKRESSGIELGNVGSSSGGESVGGSKSANKETGRPSINVSRVEQTFSKDSKPADPPQAMSALPNYQQWMSRNAKKHLPLKRLQVAYDRARKFVLQIQDIPPSKDGRHIHLDVSQNTELVDERTGKPYITNFIRSSKYTAYNFLPRQLFAQFSKFANAYFLCISILQLIPGLSTTGTYTTIVPLLFFVALSMGKEGYEDLRRHRLDKAENTRIAHVLRSRTSAAVGQEPDEAEHFTEESTHWASIKWQSLQVGDVVKIERDEAIPADILLLGSKVPNNTAYIETMALDGETNLKPKKPLPSTVEAGRTQESLARAEMEVVVEDPNLDLYNFEGRLTTDGKTSPLTNNEIIYRGSVLRNTPEAFGIIIYSGEECKIRMNANKNPRIKAPALQTVVNRIVLAIAGFVVFLALFNSIAYQVWQNTTEEKAWYIENAPVSFGPLFTSFIIMFNTLIPLSLYVSLEIIKVAQMILLNDIDMYDEESNTPFEARTSTINEELGQVGWIFSDKTGTLTENVMRFRKLSVAGTAWLHDADLQQTDQEDDLKEKQQSKGKRPVWRSREATEPKAAVPLNKRPGLPRRSTSQWRSSAAPGMVQSEQSTQELIEYMQQHPDTAFANHAKMMLLSLALCHTCLPERADDEDDNAVTYQASSPDELALVEAAKELGYLAYERDASMLTLKTYPRGLAGEAVSEKYEVLDVIEFSSKRKRMSVIVRMPDGRVCTICKGADSVIMPRLRLAAIANEKLAEIEKRSHQRKSMEAHEALRRKSSVIERSGSVGSGPRTSIQLSRRSTTIRRPSAGRLEPIRDEVDQWLATREQDVDQSPRASLALSEGRGSLHPGTEQVDDTVAADESVVIEKCLQHINEFATEGLRTLLYGYRFLNEEEYRSWKKIYHEATTSLVDRQTLIEKAGELIEQHLELGGATAIEDKLQKGVPETIDRLRRANIRMWMLTGDKRETAINIGHSCRLIKDYSSVTVLDHEAGGVEQKIAASILDINSGGIAHAVVVVDGQTLATIQTDEALHTLFLDLAVLTDSVICCRASPSQKAGLVNSIRTRIKGSVTLAIGDGANDIAMIQEAQVGIGITGKEGLQAARTSDYAIAQFRFLTKLLLVHGRWNYVRTCKYAVGTFSKEMLFYLTQALYQRYNGYSGTSLYESWSLSMFNTLFTSLTIIFLGIFEQDLRASTLIAVPELYTKGQRSAGFNLKVYVGWMFIAIAEAMIVFFTMWGLWGDAIFSAENTIFPMGNMTFTACVIIIALKLQVIEQRFKSIMAFIAVFLSVGCWFLWNIILGATYSDNFQFNVKGGIFSRWGNNGLWWVVLIVIIVACCLLEIGIRAVKCAFWPTDVEIFQTLEQDKSVRRRFEEAARPWMSSCWGHDDAEEAQKGEGDDLLSTPGKVEEGLSSPGLERIETEEEIVMIADGQRKRTDLSAMLNRKFGLVRSDTLK